MKQWDIFISYAHEDIDTASALADQLRKAGLQVWIDQQELRLGDSLRTKIDQGLSQSRFGLVLLSPDFIRKHWPVQELNGLFAREDGGERIILPVWHNLQKQDLVHHSPLLADRIAAKTEDGLIAVARQIVQVVLLAGKGSPSIDKPTVKLKLLDLLDKEPEPGAVLDFLRLHDWMIHGIFRHVRGINWRPAFGSCQPDIVVGCRQHTLGCWWYLLILESTCRNLSVQARGEVEKAGASVIAAADKHVHELTSAEEVFRLLPNEWGNGVESLRLLMTPLQTSSAMPHVPAPRTFDVTGILVRGRRSAHPEEQTRIIRGGPHAGEPPVYIHTYDWLVEVSGQSLTFRY